MASKEEQIELGKLVLRSELDVLYIKNVESEELVNEHGWMKIRVLASKQLSESDRMRVIGMPMSLLTKDGETVFGGICMQAQMLCQNQYS